MIIIFFKTWRLRKPSSRAFSLERKEEKWNIFVLQKYKKKEGVKEGII
jgi:hypothetical protein